MRFCWRAVRGVDKKPGSKHTEKLYIEAVLDCRLAQAVSNCMMAADSETVNGLYWKEGDTDQKFTEGSVSFPVSDYRRLL